MLNNVNKLYMLIFVTICQRRLPVSPIMGVGSVVSLNHRGKVTAIYRIFQEFSSL